MQIRLAVLALSLLAVPPAGALQSSNTSPTLPSQTATATTLPPAQPSNNDTNPCDFTDRDTLLDRVVSDWQGYNISLFVETCPDVCVLIYGDGNPDVSGIGVLISYVWQFTSSLFLGPGLLCISAFKGLDSDTFNQFLSMVADEVLPSTNSGNNWIMFSVLVASIIRLLQSPPVFEIDFIKALIWFQWLLLFARSVITSTLAEWLDHSQLRNNRSILALFTAVTLFIAWITSIVAGYPADAAERDALVAISRFCAFENDLPVPLYNDVPQKQTPDLGWELIPLILTGPYIYLIAMVVVMCVLAAVGFLIALAAYVLWGWLMRIMRLLWAKLPRLMKKQLAEVGNWTLLVLPVLLPGIIWIALSVWVLRLMQGYRNDLQKALGKQYQDSYWGFGQVTIVIMLLPSIYDMLSKIIRFRPEIKDEHAQGQEEHHESQPLVGSDSSSQRSSIDEQIHLQFDLPASGEGRNHATESMAESSSRSSRTPGANASHDAGFEATSAEEGFELKQRVNTFPKDPNGNILPVHNAK